ncbi:MAG: hypothetical protein OEM26_19390, partial [Saprospiraceae bacterium]|nr:hypothetical protein [Saprospiraceae bacterium]
MQHNWISVLFSMTVLLIACSQASRSPERHDQPGFRIRSDFAVPLNSSDGWAGGLNENVTVEADQPFRIRFEWENPEGLASSKQFHLQYRRNGGNWTGVEAHDFPYPTREMTMEFSVLESGSRPDGWRVVNDEASEIVVSTENDQRFLRAQANENPSTILYNPPWLVTEVVTRFRLHSENRQGIAFILDYTDHLNYSQVQLDPMSGIIRVSEVLDGNEIIRTESDAVIPAGEWLDIEIDFEGRDVKVNFQNDLIEFEAQLEKEIVLSPLGFEIAPNHGSDFQYFALSGEAQSPRVSIVTSTAFQHGTATTDLLDRSDKPFQAGAGISGSNVTPEWSGSNIHGEFEWPVVIRRFADGAVTNNEGDTFEFRMIDSSSTEPAAAAKPLLTLSIPPAHVGGTFVESPARIGPWQASNGDLYFIMEPTETDNVFMIIKSSDDGLTWIEVDGANRPVTNDLESVDSRLVGNTIHIIHQVTSSTVYHAFRTSDHPTDPDTWAIRDEPAGSVEAIAQNATMEVRPDGSICAFYLGQEKIHYSVRSH